MADLLCGGPQALCDAMWRSGVQKVAQGDVILQSQQPTTVLYIVGNGEVKASRGRGHNYEESRFLAGDIFGDAAFLGTCGEADAKYVASSENVNLLLCTREIFQEAVGDLSCLQPKKLSVSPGSSKGSKSPKSANAFSRLQNWFRHPDKGGGKAGMDAAGSPRSLDNLDTMEVPSTVNCLMDLTLDDKIGEGMSCNVFRGTVVCSSTPCAVKVMKNATLKRENLEQMAKKESDLITKVLQQQPVCPFITYVHGVFEDKWAMYIVMELADSNLEQLVLAQPGALDASRIQRYASHVVMGLEHLHDRGVLYRDLKPANLLLCSNDTLKLTDFGLSKRLSWGRSKGDYERAMTACGTSSYAAPEVLDNKGGSFPADCWSLGILIFYMFVGYTPFANQSGLGDDGGHTIFNIMNNRRCEFPSCIPSTARDLVDGLLVHDESKRLTLAQPLPLEEEQITLL
ncbi:hypothetical protein CYMTET_36113 [Cymbomonas tetramitiformis]|uniref:cGMP-dependent protein kinase n=1 Tax=Cymbomonas tetramitiformis TaxID=36881 RepID=A0AAE0F7W7_9CHLO|nr:hypothetical protein CYMTET_36113 [Cymbomonas tetramitiformis]